MKTILRAAALAATLGLASVGTAQAQTAERTYEPGSIWTVGYIETKPGMFNDYMAYLNGPWKTIQETRKKAGDVLSYKILSVNAPRDGEANLMLLVEYKNMAVFDREAAEIDRQTAQVFGSTVKAAQLAAAREAIRTGRGGLLTRELKLK
jgi:hypothetical protein